ncbi:MAG: GNAT family N-acetyltransferase [Desulfococcaceae bacterium]|jgi:hypothetical protein|nr:GNAT family N-acetyltransferase [Desulfococcaceae bacterium]
MNFEIRRLVGHDSSPFIGDLARLRIEVFREYPYLYEGSPEYEEKYLKSYADCAESLIVAVFLDGKVVGASTGLPLEAADRAFRVPFSDKGYAAEKVFYFGESVLKRQYRGRGMYGRFFSERESYAKSLDRFDFVTFCAVERPARHPLRPAAYVPLDRYWKKKGYEKQKDMRCFFPWKDLGEESESLKPMVFWTKNLADSV